MIKSEFKYVRAYSGEELIKELKRIPVAYRLVSVIFSNGEYEAFLQLEWN